MFTSYKHLRFQSFLLIWFEFVYAPNMIERVSGTLSQVSEFIGRAAIQFR
jgi:hypothetical protein